VRILVADAFEGVEELRRAGHEVVDEPKAGPDDLAGLLDGCEVLVVRSTRVDTDTIEAADDLSLIVRAGAGTNTIDTDAAAARGIYVCNTPGQNAIAVAELALGLILSIDRRIPDNVADLRAGRWDKRRYSQARGIAGRSLGIVGAGDIGLALAERAAACRMRVATVDKPGRDAATRERIAAIGIELVADLPTLLTGSDVVSIHVPATSDTEGLVDEEFLSHLRPGAWLINTSRGSVVDEDALLAAIEDKDLRAGLDVYQDEPDAKEADGWEHPLAQHPNVTGTHHIGASTEQAQHAIAAATLHVIASYARGDVVNCVNLATTALGSSTLVVRHYDRVGALSAVFDVLRTHEVNVEQMENQVFAGAVAAVATMRVSAGVTDAVLGQLRDLDDVISVSSREGS
jgi:D-3-phosphoglycerate dehydrogenase